MITAILSILGLFSSSKSSSSSEHEYSGNSDDYASGSDAGYSGRWTQNEINIQHNIDMGMAVDDDK